MNADTTAGRRQFVKGFVETFATLSIFLCPAILPWLETQRKHTSALLEEITVRSLLIVGTGQQCFESRNWSTVKELAVSDNKTSFLRKAIDVS